MNKLMLSLCAVSLTYSLATAQSTVIGYVKGAGGKPLANATVVLKPTNQTAETDAAGYFQVKNVANAHYTIEISKINYAVFSREIDAPAKGKLELGDIPLTLDPSSTDVGIVTLTDDDLVADETTQQASVGLLQASRDAFQKLAAFELGGYWFNPRGYGIRHQDILFNGTSFNKLDDGRVDFSNWGGLNDITRRPFEITDPNEASDFTFGTLGGVTYFNTRASDFRKGTSLAYSFTNRSYFHRVMATHSTGMMSNGWAFTVSGSRRWAEEGIIDGTYQDAYAYFVAIEKKLSEKHSLNFTTFGSPNRRATNSPNTQEVYDLMGKNYNSYWGWQDGKKRSERVRRTFEPVFQLTHYWDIAKYTKLTTTASYQFGNNGGTRLDWNRSNNPSPAYYKNLPSYLTDLYSSYNSDQGSIITPDEQSKIDELRTKFLANPQLNWKALYAQNEGSGGRALTYLVEDRNDDKTFNANTHFTTKLDDNWKLIANVAYQRVESDNFRQVKDLLGGQYAINSDGFATTANINTYNANYNLDNANVQVKEGDRLQYSYKLNHQQLNVNLTTKYTVPYFDVVVQASYNYSDAYRDGDFRHYLYQNNSKGRSATHSFDNYGLRAGITYKLNGRNFFTLNSSYYTLAPTLNELFLNARVNDFVTPNLKNQIINANDLTYTYKSPKFNVRLTGYYSVISNATEISRYFVEGLINLDTTAVEERASTNSFVTEATTNIRRRHIGAELGFDAQILPTLTFSGLASVGQYTYDNNPNEYLAGDILATPENPSGIIYYGKTNLKGYKTAGTPQKAFSAKLEYRSPKYWWIAVSGNYLMDNYVDVSPLLRSDSFATSPYTTNGTSYVDATADQLKALLRQQKFEDQFMLNANAGKNFRIGKYSVGVSVSVNNILNNRNYVTSGFEQARNASFITSKSDAQLATPVFGSRFWYDRGTTYFTNIYFRF